ncbi:MAG: minor capsid protein [Eggerthellaceae bacterium]|nr:minor capsid protein [Eggerthellaceae bacterium]
MLDERPIPRRLLADDMRVCVPDGRGGFAAPVEVSGVCFQGGQSVSGDAHRAADAGGGTVFVDAVNSEGAFEVPAGSRVEIGGASLYVRECKRLRGFNGRIHHWELEVS